MQILEEQTSTLNYDPHRNDDMESDVQVIGLRVEYGDYLAKENGVPMSFEAWCDYKAETEIASPELIAKSREKLKSMQHKLDNWAKGSAVIDQVIEQNRFAARPITNPATLQVIDPAAFADLMGAL